MKRTMSLAMARGLMVFAMGAAAASAAEPGPTLLLVDKGVSVAPIVIPANPLPYTKQAAGELAGYIEKISGAKPAILEGEPKPVAEHAIWVGYQPKLKELFPKLDFEFKHPEEILIAADGRHVAIVGRDRWNPDCPMRQSPQGKPMPVQQEYGTANAVYTFLQNSLGVRWLWPGALGEDIVKQPSIALAPFEYRYHPQIRSRDGLFSQQTRGFRSGRGGGEWVKFQRIALGSLDIDSGGHGFGGWWDRFHETHPEFFALQPDGTRSGFPEPNNAKMCHSNPALWDQWMADVEEQLKANPNQTVFSASPRDSYQSGHCVCEKCRAWDDPEAEMLWYHWEGLSQEYVALSDRHITFANILARKLKERYPDRDYYVSLLAYGNWRPAPVKAIPEENVLIVNVANFFWGVNAAGKGDSARTPAEAYADWGKLTGKQIWRPNTGDPAGWQKGLPDVPFGRRIEAFRYAADHHAIGIYVDLVWNHWATQGPIYYLMAQLAWNPRADGRAILDDYYGRAFGPASGELKAYWTLMEEARNRKCDDYPGESNGYAEVYNAAFFDRAYGLLDQAAKQAASAPERYSQRIGFVRVGLDYTKRIAELRELMKQWRSSKGQDETISTQVKAKWDDIHAMAKAHPDALNWRVIQPGSRNVRRGGGLHPDFLR